MKRIAHAKRAPAGHWVGDGFPVRSLFSYGDDAAAISPFLLFDYAGPHMFAPATHRRGVGEHPHRGFETVTIVYEGEVTHRDSAGGGGTIGPGDVQWMTAAGGVLHDEFHSEAFTESGGRFRVVQLWVNLPARHKMSAPAYQSIDGADIPVMEFAGAGAALRVIAGNFAGTAGAARTFSPVNVWDLRFEREGEVGLDLPEGHTALLAVLDGRLTVNDSHTAAEAELIRFAREGSEVRVRADGAAGALILTGAPIDEPVVGYGPFVMNSSAEIRQAIEDVQRGRFGRMMQ